MECVPHWCLQFTYETLSKYATYFKMLLPYTVTSVETGACLSSLLQQVLNILYQQILCDISIRQFMNPFAEYVNVHLWKDVKLPLYRSGQAPSGPGGWRSQNFNTLCTWAWQHCQPIAPAAFATRKYFWYSFLLEAESTRAIVVFRRIKSTKNPKDPIMNGKRDLPVCSLNELHHSVHLDLCEAKWYMLYLWFLQHTCLTRSAQMAVA